MRQFHFDLLTAYALGQEEEQKRWRPLLAEYLEEEAQRLSFRLKRAEVETHLTRVGEWLFKLHEAYSRDEDLSVVFKATATWVGRFRSNTW